MDRSPFDLFGERAATLLQEWQRDNKRDLSSVVPIDTGDSGALLVSVHVRDRGNKRQRRRRMIIKLCAPDASVEAERLKAAWDSCPEGDERFRTAHLVEPLYDPMPVDDAKMIFQAVAGEREMVTLGAILREGRLPAVATAITNSLLVEWNPDEDGSEMTAAAFVSELLDRRAAPDSALNAWVREHVGVTPDEPLVKLPGHGTVPNPLCLRPGCPLDKGLLPDAPRGRAHRDLHPENVMVPKGSGAEADAFVLIDLSRFAENALLACDPVHLMLGLVAAGFLPHLSQDARGEVIGLLVGREPAGLLVPQGLRSMVDGMRAASDAWARGLDLTITWGHQWLLSLQACALMFTARDKFRGRKLEDVDRWWFYCLAAEAAKAYLQAIDRYEPDAPVVTGRAPISAQSPAPATPPSPAPSPLPTSSPSPASSPPPASSPTPTPTGRPSAAEPGAALPLKELDAASVEALLSKQNKKLDALRARERNYGDAADGNAPAGDSILLSLRAFDPKPLCDILEQVRTEFERPLELLVTDPSAQMMPQRLRVMAKRAHLLDMKFGEGQWAASGAVPTKVSLSVRHVEECLREALINVSDVLLLVEPVDTDSPHAMSFYAVGDLAKLRKQLVKSLRALLSATGDAMRTLTSY